MEAALHAGCGVCSQLKQKAYGGYQQRRKRIEIVGLSIRQYVLPHG